MVGSYFWYAPEYSFTNDFVIGSTDNTKIFTHILYPDNKYCLHRKDMSQGNSSSFAKETISASRQLSVPIGQNLTNATTRSLVPSMGAISYGSDANLLYFGSTDTWNTVSGIAGSTGIGGSTGNTGLGATGRTGMTGIGTTGTTGQTGQTGQPGVNATGYTGPTGLSDQVTQTSAYFWIVGTNTTSTVITQGSNFIFTNSDLPGNAQITYNSGTGQITVLQGGRYLVSFGYNSNGGVTNIASLYINASTALRHTLINHYNATNIFDTHPTLTEVLTLGSGDVITLRNSITSSATSITLLAETETPAGQVAFLSIVRLM